MIIIYIGQTLEYFSTITDVRKQFMKNLKTFFLIKLKIRLGMWDVFFFPAPAFKREFYVNMLVSIDPILNMCST